MKTHESLKLWIHSSSSSSSSFYFSSSLEQHKEQKQTRFVGLSQTLASAAYLSLMAMASCRRRRRRRFWQVTDPASESLRAIGSHADSVCGQQHLRRTAATWHYAHRPLPAVCTLQEGRCTLCQPWCTLWQVMSVHYASFGVHYDSERCNYGREALHSGSVEFSLETCNPSEGD
jgi:hypothetical protein